MKNIKNKVLLLTDSLENGGAERQFTMLASALKHFGNVLVWSWNDGPFRLELQKNGVFFIIPNKIHKYDPRPMLNLWYVILKFKPDIVHSWGWISTTFAGPICKLLNIPIVESTVRLATIPTKRSLMTRLSWIWANYCISNSQIGLEAWKVPIKKRKVIYNGFDFNRIKKSDKNEKRNRPFTVVMTGRMSQEKDFQTVIEAAKIIYEKGKNIKFLLIGSGPDKNKLIETSKQLIEKGVLSFPDSTLDVIPYLINSDVGVLMTNNKVHLEGCSNSIMEYMACGLPVICSDSGGNKELVIDRQTGFIIEPFSVDQLVEKIIYLFENPSISDAFGEAGKNRIKTSFSLEKYINETINLYMECIN